MICLIIHSRKYIITVLSGLFVYMFAHVSFIYFCIIWAEITEMQDLRISQIPPIMAVREYTFREYFALRYGNMGTIKSVCL